jgi:hypothetical protein
MRFRPRIVRNRDRESVVVAAGIVRERLRVRRVVCVVCRDARVTRTRNEDAERLPCVREAGNGNRDRKRPGGEAEVATPESGSTTSVAPPAEASVVAAFASASARVSASVLCSVRAARWRSGECVPSSDDAASAASETSEIATSVLTRVNPRMLFTSAEVPAGSDVRTRMGSSAPAVSRRKRTRPPDFSDGLTFTPGERLLLDGANLGGRYRGGLVAPRTADVR